MNRFDDNDPPGKKINMEDLAKLKFVDEQKCTWPAGEKFEMKSTTSMATMILGKEEMKEEYLKRETFRARYIGYLEPDENLAIVRNRSEEDEL